MTARVNIKDPHTVELARSLARLEGKSVTAVVKEALQEMQERQATLDIREKVADQSENRT